MAFSGTVDLINCTGCWEENAVSLGSCVLTCDIT